MFLLSFAVGSAAVSVFLGYPSILYYLPSSCIISMVYVYLGYFRGWSHLGRTLF